MCVFHVYFSPILCYCEMFLLPICPGLLYPRGGNLIYHEREVQQMSVSKGLQLWLGSCLGVTVRIMAGLKDVFSASGWAIVRAKVKSLAKPQDVTYHR